MRRSLPALLLLSSSAALAQPVALTDHTAATEPVSTRLTPQSLGVGSGFGGMIGARPGGDPIELAVDSDVAGGLQLDLRNGVCMGASDYAVIYLDTRSGGFETTGPLTDSSDPGRAAVSGLGTDGSVADVTFPTAPAPFEADYAIAVSNVSGAPSANLFELVAGGALTFVAAFDATEVVVGCSHLRLDGVTVDRVGLAPGDSFRWVATLLNSSNGFRSNEVQGAFATTPTNPGAAAFVIGGYNQFTLVPGVRINELDTDQAASDSAEFIELLGGPGTQMDGAALVLFDGADDASYLAIDLDGEVLDGDGYLLLGNPGVSGVSLTFADDSLQDGADGVGLYLADASAFPNDTAVSAGGLVDGLVYATSDPDDAGLSAVLLAAGEAAVDENGGGDGTAVSVGRCPNGAGAPGEASAFRTTLPTPRMANECVRCGDGFTDGGESCDDGVANGTAASCCTTGCTVEPDCGDMGPPESDMFVETDMLTPESDMGGSEEADLGAPADLGASTDFGTADLGTAPDAGFDPLFDEDDGCSCHTPGGGHGSSWPALLLVAGLAFAVRRRR